MTLKQKIDNYLKSENYVSFSLVILLIFMIGSVFGASFADNNWKRDINKVSNTPINLVFDDSGYIYQITKINYTFMLLSNFYNISTENLSYNNCNNFNNSNFMYINNIRILNKTK